MNGIYVWQKKDWPDFRWNTECLIPLLSEDISSLSFFLGRLSMMGKDVKESIFRNAIENEVVSSNSIEDIMLKRSSVRSSILSRLGVESEGLEKSDRYTAGAVSIVFDAVTNCDNFLTKERLFTWHRELFPSSALRFS